MTVPNVLHFRVRGPTWPECADPSPREVRLGDRYIHWVGHDPNGLQPDFVPIEGVFVESQPKTNSISIRWSDFMG